jgi:hypothetical protein
MRNLSKLYRKKDAADRAALGLAPRKQGGGRPVNRTGLPTVSAQARALADQLKAERKDRRLAEIARVARAKSGLQGTRWAS